jgi:ubiquinone biosynthesis protein UbiJ
MAAYWTEEQPLVAAKPDVERFVREVDTLRDDVARLEKRIEQLLKQDAGI